MSLIPTGFIFEVGFLFWVSFFFAPEIEHHFSAQTDIHLFNNGVLAINKSHERIH